MSVDETDFLWQIVHYDMQKMLCRLLETSTVKVRLYHTSVCCYLSRKLKSVLAESLLQFIVCRGT
jgi:hypothetical protein